MNCKTENSLTCSFATKQGYEECVTFAIFYYFAYTAEGHQFLQIDCWEEELMHTFLAQQLILSPILLQHSTFVTSSQVVVNAYHPC